MADPLSIAASVAGLIALSGSLYKMIGDFVERAANPPQSAHALLLSVSEMRMVLQSVSDLIDNFLKYPPKRRALVRLDHLIICLTQAVLSFSELEKFVNPWVSRTQRTLWQRWKLTSQGERINRFNIKLQENKVSISLVLSILQCESDTDAQQYRLSLHAMMERIIHENKEIRTRVDELGSFLMSSAPSITTTFGRPGASSSAGSMTRAGRGDYDGASTLRELESVQSSTISGAPNQYRHSASWPLPVRSALGLPRPPSEPNFRLPFENELAQSRVYTRARHPQRRISSTTSQPMSGVWSMLSGLSLGQISNISVITLPITLNDIPNSSWYKDSIRKPVDLAEVNQTEVSKDKFPVNMFYNIAVLGECEVGKSTLTTTLCFGHSVAAEKYSTLGVDYYTSIRVDGTESRLRITDTPGLGSSEYAIMVNEAIKNAEAFVLVYSVTDQNSFSRIRSLYDAIIRTKQMQHDKRPPVVIVANKADLEESSVISPESAFSLADELNCTLFECSVKHDDSIARPFIELVRCMLGSGPLITGDRDQATRKLVRHRLLKMAQASIAT
ncbi:P-loop containing nucleoside triphosphate hydrolase protein [Ustulina deusta]|nr:P-loop containing nucleoside triphosphate hydrolase protein [Ustulina deusta]